MPDAGAHLPKHVSHVASAREVELLLECCRLAVPARKGNLAARLFLPPPWSHVRWVHRRSHGWLPCMSASPFKPCAGQAAGKLLDGRSNHQLVNCPIPGTGLLRSCLRPCHDRLPPSNLAGEISRSRPPPPAQVQGDQSPKGRFGLLARLISTGVSTVSSAAIL